MGFLSVMSKGTTEEKIMWSFDFLDLDRNGFIEKQEMLKVKLNFQPVGRTDPKAQLKFEFCSNIAMSIHQLGNKSTKSRNRVVKSFDGIRGYQLQLWPF